MGSLCELFPMEHNVVAMVVVVLCLNVRLLSCVTYYWMPGVWWSGVWCFER